MLIIYFEIDIINFKYQFAIFIVSSLEDKGHQKMKEKKTTEELLPI